MSWLSELLPASWRGMPFQVRASEYTGGRRTAVHTYPFRDKVWVEDLGLGPRLVAFTGFLVGDDCALQAVAMRRLAEVAGPGTLIHPTLGYLQITLTGPFRFGERAETGRVIEFQFTGVEGASPLYPSASASGISGLLARAGDALDSVLGDFGDTLSDALDGAASVASSALETASSFAGEVLSAAGDVSMITGAVTGLVPVAGTFGRYATGNRSSLLSGVSTVTGALSAVTTARGVVESGCSRIVALAEAL